MTSRWYRRGSAWSLCGVFAAIALFGASTALAGSAPRRIVLVSIDGLAPTSVESPLPALAALAASGRSCDALAPAPEPFPAWVELLSGCEPARTGVWNETSAVRPDDAHGRRTSLAAVLRAAGYRTLALPADPLAHAGTPVAVGFERYDLAAPALAESARVDSALAWLERPGKRFAWLALSPHTTPPAWRRTDGVGPQDPGRTTWLAEIDRALARLSAALGALERDRSTLVVVAGTGSADGTTTRVPVAFAGPAARALQLTGVVHLADVAPTVAAIAGARANGFDGVDLASSRSAAARAARALHRAAPADTLELPGGTRAVFVALTGATAPPDSLTLGTWDSLRTRFPASARLALERALAQSRSGQEVTAARTLKAMATAMPDDPRPAFAYAEHLVRFRRESIAADILRTIDPNSPFGPLALWRRSVALAEQEDFVPAEGDARRAARWIVPNDAAAALPERLHALAALHDSCVREPRDGAMRLRYGRTLAETGLLIPAYGQFHIARALAPTSAEPDYWLAFYLLREGRPQHAQPALERGLAHDSTYTPARHVLVEALLEQGKRREARVQLERLSGTGLDAREWYNLACLRAADGVADPALDALQRAVAAGYDDWDQIARDPDLDRLRSDARFPTPPHAIAR